MDKYLNGTILEMLERVKILKTKIRTDLPDCFHQLAAHCTTEVDALIGNLEKFRTDPKYQVSGNLRRKLIDFQEEIRYIDYFENKIIAPLHRCNDDDVKFTKLIQKVCKEIKYPLLSPVASRLSQEYYCIDTKFNHMRVPLLEADFLLHMPDLYHELAHPLIAAVNDLRTVKFQEAFIKFLDFVDAYCQTEIVNYKRNNGTEEAKFLELFSKSWFRWGIEFFCDLYACYTLGPAYAWANLHLCIKRGSDPFETPIYFPSSHPSDDARMRAVFYGLELLNFKKEVQIIKEYWQKYLTISGGDRDANYKMAFPDHIIEHCALLALEGTKEIKSQLANENNEGEVYNLLNLAWKKFTSDPIDYIGWEKLQREKYEV